MLTLWAIGKEPEKFRAAVALRPVVDWTDQVTAPATRLAGSQTRISKSRTAAGVFAISGSSL